MNRTFNLSLLIILFLLLASLSTLFAQTITGKVFIDGVKSPAEYVNIGIIGKQIGTVSDGSGKFSIEIPTANREDSLYFSRIGLERKGFKISDLLKMKEVKIFLSENKIALNEFKVVPKTFKKKILGVRTKSKSVGAGFNNYHLGYELGLRMNVRKPTYIQKVNINISFCTYDSIFLRLNIYKVEKDDNFENILLEPIYISLPKSALNNTISIDLSSQYLYVEDDFIVSLEYVRELGEGELMFSASMISQATYFRETSQGKWNKIPAPIGISINAEVETEN
jgi:hypothetical protein